MFNFIKSLITSVVIGTSNLQQPEEYHYSDGIKWQAPRRQLNKRLDLSQSPLVTARDNLVSYVIFECKKVGQTIVDYKFAKNKPIFKEILFKTNNSDKIYRLDVDQCAQIFIPDDIQKEIEADNIKRRSDEEEEFRHIISSFDEEAN